MLTSTPHAAGLHTKARPMPHWSTGNGHLNSVQAGWSSAGGRAGTLWIAPGAAIRPIPMTAARSALFISSPRLRQPLLRGPRTRPHNASRPRRRLLGEAARPDPTLFVVVVVVVVVVAVAAANLAANFAGREVRGVDIGVGGVGLNYRNQCVEVSCRQGLRCDGA